MNESFDSGSRSHGSRRLESVAQVSVVLQDTDPTLDPALASLSREAAAEGVVLLHNDGVLPLESAQKVALFGRVQLDWFAVGYGSGGDVKVPYVWNLLDGLRDAGISVDAELADVYTQWSDANQPAEGEWGSWPHSFPEMPIDSALITAAAGRTDTAVVVIGRAAGEARESELTAGSFYLTEQERALLDQVTDAFARTIVVLDVGNVIDLSWIADYDDRLGAVLLAWQGGMEGARAVAAVLSGEIAPSGKLTDTIAWSYSDYPSAANFGGHDFNVYAEDIFVGYRYFESFAKDRVQYPFGFGLTYTWFAVAVDVVVADSAAVNISVTVTNSGEVAGREVVQAYLRAPDGALSQPARRLAAFAKTGLLEPGASENLELTFTLAEVASFDDSDATGHQNAWVLEAGEYELYVGTDVRSAPRAGSFTLPELQVVRQVSEAAAPTHPFSRMVLSRNASGAAEVAWQDVPQAVTSLRERIIAGLPAEIAVTGDVGITLDDVAAGTHTLDAFIAQLSPEELAELTRGDVTMHSALGAPGNAGVFGGVSESLRAKGVPAVTTTDGPSGIRLAAYASLLPSGTALASTWNPALVRELATLHGQEMVRKGSDVLLSPGMNIHRDPLCGRNFEYFSEDPLITGRAAAAVVAGVQAAGVSACPKHFAVNNQETNRTGNDSRLSQRALREIYLRGFEICITEAAPQAIMTSYNLVNGVWAHYNYDLVTTILRGEWGYQGVVMTDWWIESSVDPDFPALSDNAYRVRSQVDVLMPGGIKTEEGPTDQVDDSIALSLAADDGLTIAELQRGARNVLRFALGSQPFAGRA